MVSWVCCLLGVLVVGGVDAGAGEDVEAGVGAHLWNPNMPTAHPWPAGPGPPWFWLRNDFGGSPRVRGA